MNDQLVDSNGFPRSDIDLVVVRTARSNIIRKFLPSLCVYGLFLVFSGTNTFRLSLLRAQYARPRYFYTIHTNLYQ